MNIYLQMCWEYVINFLESGIFYYYIRTLLPPKKMAYQTWFHILAVMFRFFIISICNTIQLTVIYTIFISLISNVFITCIFFKEKTSICLFWGATHGILCIISEFICMLFLQNTFDILPSDILLGKSYRFPITILYILILAMLSFYIPTLIPKKALFKGSQKILIIFFIILGITITHCFMLIMIATEHTHPEIVNTIILANIVFLCFFISLLVYMYQLALTQQQNEELEARAKLLELETAQYNNLLSTTKSLRSIKHDIHHHLSTIHSLIQKNESKRLTEYLEEYQTHFQLDYMVVSTGNIVIDSILSTKLYFAKQQQTKLDFSIVLPNNFPFTDVALSALLGNLFDNALDACKKLEQNRWIHFQINAQEDMLFIHMENTFDGIVKETTTGFLSRKPDANHGVGLNRVKTLVEEANGFIEIRYTKQLFMVHIMIPLEN
ncbi:MAG: GHKL domain-containing protein [Lachnospiraceae bacterium]|nr:GHKL domain-containing protein [Lachnospiraceae bacterium]